MKLLFYRQAYRPFHRSITGRKGQRSTFFVSIATEGFIAF